MLSNYTATPDMSALVLDWTDGRQSKLAAAYLRSEAKDSRSRRERIDTGDIFVADGIQIADVKAMGSMGLNISFSDGHDRAVYPISFLKELSDRNDN
ncbi:MAG: gamma-butyrobetaine hydroxylase-like domain-containing protein [Paracoccaceae bacterium]|nr:gamma-butyrobetaine hydroxylase-like domain-containing protein [Paracoccaceae bacterium]